MEILNQLPHETRLRSIEKTGDTRFGALFSAKFLEDSNTSLQDLQLISPHLLDGEHVRDQLREEISSGLDAKSLTKLILPLSAGGVCPSSSLAEDWGAWLCWPTQNGPSLMQLQRYVSSAYGADRDAYRTWISPVLETLALELDSLIESGYPSQRLSFAPEHVYTSIESRPGTLRSWTTEPPSKWTKFTVHMLPLGLDELIPLALGQDQLRRRISWLHSSLILRFASLIYGMFEGKTFPEGTPRAQSYSSALLLSETGNRALRKCIEHETPTLIFPLASSLLSAALKSDAKKSRQKDPQSPTSQAGTEPNQLGASIARRNLTPNPSIQVTNEPAGLATPTPVPSSPNSKATKSVVLIAASGLAVVAIVFGIGVRGKSSVESDNAPSKISAPFEPKTVQPVAPPKSVQVAQNPVVPNPDTKPSPTNIDPAEEARLLINSGKFLDAERILLQAADQDSGAGGRQRAFLTQAFEIKSIQGAERLGRLAGSSDPLKAAELFWQGHLWASDPSGLKNNEAASRCLREAVTLKFGPALLAEFQSLASNPTNSAAAVDSLLEALSAFDQGNASTPKDLGRRSEVVASLNKFPDVITAIEGRASTQSDPQLANALLTLASDAGSASAPARQAELIDGRYPNKSSIPLGEMDQLISSLRLGVSRNSIPAMLKLAKILNSNTYPVFTGRENQSDSKAEAKSLYFQAATLGDNEGQFGYAQALLSENQLDIARSKPPGDATRLQIVQANQANLTEAYKYLVDAERNGSKGAKGVRTLVVEAMLNEAGFPLPTL